MPGAITLSMILLAGVPAGLAAAQSETPMNDAAARPAARGSAPASVPARLPWSRGRSFATLDAYLAYLEQFNGPIDLPWWREIRPGVYQKMVRMPEAEREVVTRAELERRWGFAPAR